MRIQTKIKTIHPEATVPTYESGGAAGFDFKTLTRVYVKPKGLVLIPTGLVIQVPKGYMLNIFPRSSTFKKTGLMMPHSVGVVDEDYCGDDDEIGIQMYNPGDDEVVLNKGTRIAQGVLTRVARAAWYQSEEKFGLTRGGWGSSGGY